MTSATEALPVDQQQPRAMKEWKIAPAGGKNGVYVSPSDAILSPASQKLAGFKQKQMNKQSARNPTARSLFARTVSSTSSTSGLEDAEDIAK